MSEASEEEKRILAIAERVTSYVDEQFRIARQLSKNVDVIEDALRSVLGFSQREAELSAKVKKQEREIERMNQVLLRLVELAPKTDPVLKRAVEEWEKEKK